MLIQYCVHAHAGLGTTFGWKAPSRYWSSILVDVMNVNTSLINPQLIRGSILIVLIYKLFFTILRSNHPMVFGRFRSAFWTWHMVYPVCFNNIGVLQDWVPQKPLVSWVQNWKMTNFGWFWCFWNHRHRCGVWSETIYRWGCTSWNWRFFRFFQ